MQPNRQKRILFVDDEPSIRATLPVVLRQHGFDVTVAATVEEGINAMYSQEFDLLLADLSIEKENDGFHLICSMRDANPRCIAFIITANPSLESAIDGIHAGVVEYIVKPTNTDELIAMLSNKLEGAMGLHPSIR
jgi:DNA-binding response OmpR family regulator